MTTKDQIIKTALKNAVKFIGTDYDREGGRDKIWPGGSMDCSSYTAAIFSSAGFPLRDSLGNELRTSMYQVNAAGFDLLYPSNRAQIGQKLPSAKGILASVSKPGDIAFYNFQRDTDRKNKITHVGTVYDKSRIIHTANNTQKCCFKPFSYGETDICAVIRLRDDVVYPSLPEIRRPSATSQRPEEWHVRMLQVLLNIHQKTQLVVDGLFGPKVEAAVKALNARIGVNSDACTAKTWAALGVGTSTQPVEPEKPVTQWPVVMKIEKPLMRSEEIKQLQGAFNNLGYDTGGVDGICGEKTMKGVQAFIAAHKS